MKYCIRVAADVFNKLYDTNKDACVEKNQLILIGLHVHGRVKHVELCIDVLSL